MATADMVARRSLCSRAQVGAVIVTVDNQIIAASYNGPPARFKHEGRDCTHWCPRAAGSDLNPEYEDCPATHAEMNAIARAHGRLSDSTLYVTGSVCYSCAKVIPQSGIDKVVHRINPSEAHRRPEEVEKFLYLMGVNVERRVSR